MELSILVAKVLSLIYLSMGIAVFAGTINFKDIVHDLVNSPALTFISGAIGIAVGVILVSYHNIWVLEWNLLITLIGWLFLIGGVIVVIFPKALLFYEIKSNRTLGAMMSVIGLIFGYFALA